MTGRIRRSRLGELLQADATPFDWFGTGERSALHGFIDDATGNIIALYLCKNECLMGYLELLRQTLTVYGLPPALRLPSLDGTEWLLPLFRVIALRFPEIASSHPEAGFSYFLLSRAFVTQRFFILLLSRFADNYVPMRLSWNQSAEF